MTRFACWALLACALASCRRADRTSAASVSTDAAPLTSSNVDDARLVLEKHCGLCHLDDSPRADARALAVFDLRRPDWYASISPEQFKSARTRLADAPTGGDPASADEVATFDAFVTQEIARREDPSVLRRR
jgi:hypothetical protein